MVRDTVVANGVSLNSVNLRVLGPPPYRRQGLLSGAVDAAPLNFLQSRQAAQQGFRILPHTGDLPRIYRHSRHCDEKDSDLADCSLKVREGDAQGTIVLSGKLPTMRCSNFTSYKQAARADSGPGGQPHRARRQMGQATPGRRGPSLDGRCPAGSGHGGRHGGRLLDQPGPT